MRFGEQDLHSACQRPFHAMGEGTYAVGRIALLPEAGAQIQADVKSAKIVMSVTAARLKLDEVLQCILFVGV